MEYKQNFAKFGQKTITVLQQQQENNNNENNHHATTTVQQQQRKQQHQSCSCTRQDLLAKV